MFLSQLNFPPKKSNPQFFRHPRFFRQHATVAKLLQKRPGSYFRHHVQEEGQVLLRQQQLFQVRSSSDQDGRQPHSSGRDHVGFRGSGRSVLGIQEETGDRFSLLKRDNLRWRQRLYLNFQNESDSGTANNNDNSFDPSRALGNADDFVETKKEEAAEAVEDAAKKVSDLGKEAKEKISGKKKEED